ncbi:hypothetical protein SAMN06309944_0696 [Micrococcales bacterium KH10]|nr:hypothetical protein SAMN06309944_0696 [Micrococcales bacterium KH10]
MSDHDRPDDRKVIPLRPVIVPDITEDDRSAGHGDRLQWAGDEDDRLLKRALATVRVRESWGGLLPTPRWRRSGWFLIVVPPGTPPTMGALPARLAWWQLWGTALTVALTLAAAFAGAVIAGVPGLAGAPVVGAGMWLAKIVNNRSLVRRCGSLPVVVRTLDLSGVRRLESTTLAAAIVTSVIDHAIPPGPNEPITISAHDAAVVIARGLEISAARLQGDHSTADRLHELLWQALEPEG